MPRLNLALKRANTVLKDLIVLAFDSLKVFYGFATKLFR